MRGRRSELTVVALCAAAAAASVAIWSGGAEVVAAAAVLGGTLGLARRHPLTAWLLASAALLVTVPQGVLGLPTYALVPAHAFCAGRWAGRTSGLAATVVLIVVCELGVLVAAEAAVPFAFVPAAAWGAGRALREREQVASRLAERARELEQEREAHAQLSVRYERARIAGELHDIVAHAISVMVVQASAGQRLAAVDPESTAEAFEAIAGAAHQAEQDLGRLVELLVDGDAAAAPDVAVVDELVARAAASGLTVSLRLEGEREGLPQIVGQSAYRVVQEGLTNALRHASGASVDVLVRGDREALLVEVVNGPASGDALLCGAGTQTGLTGLRERVSAAGGELQAGPTPGGGWRLAARLSRRPNAHDA
ncbi:MAG: histidine kinase [Solirubrobacteraceae bacterium]